MHPNEEVIKKFYESFKVWNFHTMKSCYAPEAEFEDVAFKLKGADNVDVMWEMLCTRKDKIEVRVSNIHADEKTGTADWEADYLYPDGNEEPDRSKQKPIANKIKATFEFSDGKIIKHHDSCEVAKLAEMLFPGLLGVIVSRIPFLFPFTLSMKLNKKLDEFKKLKVKQSQLAGLME
jgi:hypothetical protein